MGEAKRRGTFKERKAAAIKRDARIRKEQEFAEAAQSIVRHIMEAIA